MADPFGNIPLNTGGSQQIPAAPTSAPTPAPSTASVTPAPMTITPIRAPENAPMRAPIPAPSEMIEIASAAKRMHKPGVGPVIGAVIIVILFIFGGLYFWGAHLNAQEKAPLPLISGDPVQQ